MAVPTCTAGHPLVDPPLICRAVLGPRMYCRCHRLAARTTIPQENERRYLAVALASPIILAVYNAGISRGQSDEPPPTLRGAMLACLREHVWTSHVSHAHAKR